MNAWHASPESLSDYLAGHGNPVVAASVEAHLLSCSRCRSHLADAAAATSAAETERRWVALTEQVDRLPSRPRAMLGVATRPLRRAWILALAVVVGIPVAYRLVVGDPAPIVFLALAPVIPGLAVALAYRADTDPAGEVARATPTAGLRVISQRVLLVTATALPVLILAALALGGSWIGAVAWVLPGMACAGLVLAAGTTRLDPRAVALAAGGVWAGALAARTLIGDVPAAVVTAEVAAPLAQGASLVVLLLCLVVTVARRDHVSYRRSA